MSVWIGYGIVDGGRNWDLWREQQCADSRHAYRTRRRVRVMSGGRFGVTFYVKRWIACWWCNMRLEEPRELKLFSADMDRRTALKARYGS